MSTTPRSQRSPAVSIHTRSRPASPVHEDKEDSFIQRLIISPLLFISFLISVVIVDRSKSRTHSQLTNPYKTKSQASSPSSSTASLVPAPTLTSRSRFMALWKMPYFLRLWTFAADPSEVERENAREKKKDDGREQATTRAERREIVGEAFKMQNKVLVIVVMSILVGLVGVWWFVQWVRGAVGLKDSHWREWVL